MTRYQEQNRKIEEVLSTSQDESLQIDKIAETRGWFRPEPNSTNYALIQAYLNETATIDEVATKLFTPIDENIFASTLDDVNYKDLWYSVIHSARKIEFRDREQHIKVVDIVNAFKNHTIPNNEKYNYLYSALADFDLACREAYNDTPEPESAFEVEIKAWTNLNYFFAFLTDKGHADLSLFAIWSMRQALEQSHVDDAQGTAAQKYDTYVPAAANWVFGMYRSLFYKEKDLTPTDNKQGNPAKGGKLWTGRAEFSKARWNFWQERFVVISKMDELHESTRLIAKDAVEAMERAATFEKVAEGAM